MRAGSRALSLLAVPLNVHLMKALEEESMSLVDLRRAVGSPPQTTVRSHLRALAALGIVVLNRPTSFSGSIGYELAGPGRELLGVAEILDDWLTAAPEAPLQPGSIAAKSAIKALIGGWSAAIVRALAARPLSLTELDQLIAGLSYPSLERRLAAMRLAGQIEALVGDTRGVPYALTGWTRRAIAPLAAAAGWELRHPGSGAQSIGRIDVESYFLLTVPQMAPNSKVEGACRLAVSLEGDDLAGVIIQVKSGRPISCVSRLQGDVDAWASGSAGSWIDLLIELDSDGVEVGGDQELAEAVLEALQQALSGAKQRA